MILAFNNTPTTEIYTLSLHDALPIFLSTHLDPRGARLHRRDLHRRRALGDELQQPESGNRCPLALPAQDRARSEEHTSELQSLAYLVCRLLLEKKTPRTASNPLTVNE